MPDGRARISFISIHALRKESDVVTALWCFGLESFQSTLSVRRATLILIMAQPFQAISIHALRKESDTAVQRHVKCGDISIHALRKESDLTCHRLSPNVTISIHALRKESDKVISSARISACYFNPRSP